MDTPENQVALDLRAPLPVESWLPGETLFSLASRHHVLACNPLDSDTCLQLFGHAHSRAKHDIPTHLDVFVANTRGRLGMADEIILEHTILPFYFPLTSKQRVEAAVLAVRGAIRGSLKYPLGMLLNRFSASHPLKACTLCIEEDIRQFQVAYWHCVHQYPGVWICPTHDCELHQIAKAPDASPGYGWSLPRKEQLVNTSTWVAFTSCASDQCDLLRALACASVSLAALSPDVFIDRERATRVYRERLVSIGLRNNAGQLQLPECQASLLRASIPLRSISELSALPANEDQARAFVTRLCWMPVKNMHVLRHLFAIVWLFRSWESFWTSYQESS